MIYLKYLIRKVVNNQAQLLILLFSDITIPWPGYTRHIAMSWWNISHI